MRYSILHYFYPQAMFVHCKNDLDQINGSFYKTYLQFEKEILNI